MLIGISNIIFDWEALLCANLIAGLLLVHNEDLRTRYPPIEAMLFFCSYYDSCLMAFRCLNPALSRPLCCP